MSSKTALAATLLPEARFDRAEQSEPKRIPKNEGFLTGEQNFEAEVKQPRFAHSLRYKASEPRNHLRLERPLSLNWTIKSSHQPIKMMSSFTLCLAQPNSLHAYLSYPALQRAPSSFLLTEADTHML